MPNRCNVSSSSLFIATVLIVHSSSAFQFYKIGRPGKKEIFRDRGYIYMCGRCVRRDAQHLRAPFRDRLRETERCQVRAERYGSML